jgi:uncharacterized membrane protein (TIGR02234 family)
VRREYPAALVLCLAGAVVVLVAGGQTWLQVDLTGTPPLPDRSLPLAGGDVASGARALGLVGLAGVAALPAARGWGRTVLGVLLGLAGAGVIAQAAAVLSDAEGAAARVAEVGRAQAVVASTGAPLACLAGGVLLLAAGLLVAARGRRWSALGARYDAPAARPAAAAAEPRPGAAVWDALDRGEDPTR